MAVGGTLGFLELLQTQAYRCVSQSPLGYTRRLFPSTSLLAAKQRAREAKKVGGCHKSVRLGSRILVKSGSPEASVSSQGLIQRE